MKAQLQQLQQRYEALADRDRLLLNVMTVVVAITLFFILVWEPIMDGRERAEKEQRSLQEINSWMLSAANEAKQLRSSGAGARKPMKTNSPVSLVLEQSVKTSGLKAQVKKIESSGKTRAQIRFENASFNQILLWLNNLNTRYGLHVDSSEINRRDAPGRVDARMTIRRNS